MPTNFASQKILICDDSITNVLVLSTLLESIGKIKTQTETDPRKVEPILEEQNFDLLLLDIEMPHLNGFQVMEQVRRHYDMDDLPIIILTGNSDSETRNAALALGANDFINKPFDQTEVKLRCMNLLKTSQAFKLQRNLNEELEKKVEQRTRELSDATEALIHRLALAGEMRDYETGQHVVRVGKYSRLLAEKLGLPNQLAFMIEKTAPLHDIGKVGIPDSILLKKGPLSDDERRVMFNHTEYGVKLLGDHPSILIQMAATIAGAHHEKWDGSGYPKALKGESIPIEGRITGLSDVFDALTVERPYKQAWPIPKVVEYLKEQSGVAFDPSLVELLLDNLDEFLKIKQEYAD